MEVKKRLLMTFKNKIGRTLSIAVDDPKKDLTETQIKEVMDLIVSKNIFAPNGSDIVEAIEAKVVITDITSYDLVL